MLSLLLFTSLLLLPQTLSHPFPPPFNGSPGGSCNTSFSPWAWDLRDVYYHSSITFSTPSHQIDGGYISFSLTQPALTDQTFECSASSTQLQDFFYGNQWFGCGGDEVGQVGRAEFMFDRVTGKVVVRESWVCEGGREGGERFPVYFNATGSGMADLKCNETRWTNANWTMGQIYSTDVTECAKVDLRVEPSEIMASS